jgi:anti-anti-sigma factor
MNATLTVEGVATIVLSGETDASSVPQLRSLLSEAARVTPDRLVVDVGGLAHLPAVVLRCLVYAHQRLGRGVRIALVGASADVADAVRMASLADVLSLTG